MMDFFRYFAKRRGALSAVFIIHIFTLIPASMLLWLEDEHHVIYFIFAGGIAVITSWIIHDSGRELLLEIENFAKSFLVPANILFGLLYLVFVFGVTTFYLYVAKLFAPFEINYLGPSRLLAFFVVMVCYNSFFLSRIFKKS